MFRSYIPAAPAPPLSSSSSSSATGGAVSSSRFRGGGEPHHECRQQVQGNDDAGGAAIGGGGCRRLELEPPESATAAAAATATATSRQRRPPGAAASLRQSSSSRRSDEEEGEGRGGSEGGAGGGVGRDRRRSRAGEDRPASLASSFSRSSSFVVVAAAASTSPALATANPSGAHQVRQLAAVLLVTLLSWNVPRFLIARETSIARKPAPYQLLPVGSDNSNNNNELVVLNPELNQPLVDPPTIPSGFLVWTSVGVPLLAVLLVACATRPSSAQPYSRLPSWEAEGTKDNGKDRSAAAERATASWATWRATTHAGICGALTSIALVEGPTQLLKLYVQRRRPNFYALCGFDIELRTCTAPVDRVRDATFSFPSGHSSLATAGMAYLSYFLLSRTVHASASASPPRSPGWLLHRHKPAFALMSVLLPYAWCAFVAASRIVDMWHHPSDVLAGLWLGFVGATLSYHCWFPPVWISQLPWSLLRHADVSAAAA